jgi:hypothetical protein
MNELKPWTSSVADSQWEGLPNQPADNGDDDEDFPVHNVKAVGEHGAPHAASGGS